MVSTAIAEAVESAFPRPKTREDLSLHPGQMQVYMSKARFKVVVAGRRWGKTACARTLIIQMSKIRKRKIWYVAPTYRMAKQIMWRDLLDTLPRSWIRKVNETTMSITLVNKTVIELKGADKADSLRGVGIHYLVLDEFQDMSEDTWTKVLRPTLADTGGHALFLGTPKSFNNLHTVFMNGQDKKKNPTWESWQFPTITSPFIPKSEIEAARRDMDEKSFRQEFMACHLPDTEVLMFDDSKKKIKELVIGDLLQHLRDNGEIAQCEVLNVGETGIKVIVTAVLETGEQVTASAHHKFKVH